MLKKSPLANAAGKRNNFVTIERATDADANDVNEVLPEWSILCQRFAASKPTTGAEFNAAMTVQPMLKAILELPYDSATATITPRDRIKDGARSLNIAAVFNEGENNEKIILWVIEPVAA
jgi:head-tail adaptor